MIRRLDEATIRQIAAGEVIERPASALRELLDNALDAGAKDVSISLCQGGKTFLSVSDDGCGLSKEEILLAPVLHATSKIQSIEDLTSLQSFGFRGEALASLAEVSSFSLSSRLKNTEHGWHYAIDCGKPEKPQPKGMNPGTEIVIENLFYQLPARLKFLGSDTGEYRACISELIKKALAYPQCAFQLNHNGQETYNLSPAPELYHRIKDLFPDTPLQPFSHTEEDFSVYGFISPPSWYRPTRSQQFFFVNTRPIEWPALRGQIVAAYGNLLPPGKFPACFIYLDISPEYADFNVHPQKREIRFQNETLVATLIRRALRSALNFIPESVKHNSSFLDTKPSRSISLNEGNNQNLWSKPRGDSGLHHESFAKRSYVEQSQKKEEIPLFASPLSLASRLKSARYVGNFFRTYLLFELENTIFGIDFHALHERIRYQIILEEKNLGLQPQQLLIPLSFSLPKQDADILAEILDAFQTLGFSLTRIGDTEFSTDTLPMFLDTARAEESFMDLFYLMKDTPNFSDAQFWDATAKCIACKGATKSGDNLSFEEIQSLLDVWNDRGCLMSCPHGRPICVQWDRVFFDKAFKRLGF